MTMTTEEVRPTAPILGVDERKDIKAFYHNTAYRAGRAQINIEKMKILKDRLSDCVRAEGVNYVEKCDQLAKRFEAVVRVCQENEGPTQRPRNVGNILVREKALQEQLRTEAAA